MHTGRPNVKCNADVRTHEVHTIHGLSGIRLARSAKSGCRDATLLICQGLFLVDDVSEDIALEVICCSGATNAGNVKKGGHEKKSTDRRMVIAHADATYLLSASCSTFWSHKRPTSPAASAASTPSSQSSAPRRGRRVQSYTNQTTKRRC